jgi:drug/metabolite transporter (DMT)-like permease
VKPDPSDPVKVPPLSFYDWMLALHLLAAFAVAAALVLYSVLVVSGRRMTTLDQAQLLFRLAPIGTPLIAGGTVLVLILGVVLAIDADEYQLWDAWILAGIVLWALLGAVGQRSGAYYTEVQRVAERGEPGAEAEVFARLRAPTGARLHVATVGIFVLLLLDMIFKPGA